MKQTQMAVDYKLISVTSTAFKSNELMPSKYTCDGLNINPELLLEHIPPEAKSIAIIVDDPDVSEDGFCHWAIWNLPVTKVIRENENRGAQGMNDFSHHKYNGPCREYGTNRYFFKVYTLDTKLEIPVSSCKSDLESAMSNHVTGFGFLVGRYKKEDDIFIILHRL